PLVQLHGTFAICKFPADAALPMWSVDNSLFSVTRTPDEVSVVCHQDLVPEDIRREGGWLCFRVCGTIDFALIGVLASLVSPLANVGVAVFVLSTFDTDYLLVKEQDADRVIDELIRCGHSISPTVERSCAEPLPE